MSDSPTSTPTSGSISSIKKAHGGNFEDLVAAGREIAATLEQGDLTGEWMAHHLAELLDKLERADADARPALEQETADLVLAVWDRKGRWPIDGHQPLDALQPLLSAVARLQPDQPDWSFFQYFRETDPPDASVSNLLKAAVLVERSVRDVVRGCIVVASQQVMDTEAPWLEVARQLCAEDEATLVQRLRRRLATPWDGSDAADLPATPAPVENLRQDVVKLQQFLAEVVRVLASEDHSG